ncbi:MAG: WD40 repeat domain-containing protein [Cellvibrionaceae bacterium]
MSIKYMYSLRTFFVFFSISISAISGCNKTAGPSSSIEVAAVGAYGGTFSDDGKLAIVGSINHGGSLWRVRDRERVYNWNHHQGDYTQIIAADFSPEGDWAITADEHTMVLWKTSDGSAHRFWTTPGSVLSIALSQNGRYALLGLSNNTAVIFDVQRGGIRRTFHHQAPVTSVDLSDDNKFALTGSEDNTAVLWDIDTNKPAHTIQHSDYVLKVALSPNGNRAFSAARYDKAIVWDTETGSISGEIPLATEKLKRGLRFTSVKFSDDGYFLLTGLPDRVVQLWNAKHLTEAGQWTLPKRDQWKPSSAAVLAVGFSERTGIYYAMASNGFIHQLNRIQKETK